MSDLYVYSSTHSSNNYTTAGLCGALEPNEAVFSETLNGDSYIELKHPIDKYGKYTYLVQGNIIVAPVPVRQTPEIQNGSIVTTVWTYKVKPDGQFTNIEERQIFTNKELTGAIATLDFGEKVTVVEKQENPQTVDSWKVKSDKGTGWILAASLELENGEQHQIGDNSKSIEDVQPSTKIMEQYFRIFEVKKEMSGITVKARHITYDLLYNITSYESSTSVSLGTAASGILSNCYSTHNFEIKTNITDTQAGLFFNGKNPIDALLDPEEGLCAMFEVSLVRDNNTLYLLKDPGLNRGVTIEYGKNMTGVSYSESYDELVTRVIPVGETADGDELYLENTKYIDSDYINNYPVHHVYWLECENCKVGDKDYESGSEITEAVARARMAYQAKKLMTVNGVEGGQNDKPTLSIEVDYISLGDTVEYANFKDLERCYLADYVLILHPNLGISVTARVTEIEWNIVLEKMNEITVGEVGKTIANTGITTWQIPSGISGSKIASDSISSSSIKDNTISARHIQSSSVTTNKLVAGSVTADKIAAGTIETGSISAVTAKVQNFTAQSIDTDLLAAAMASFQVIVSGTATFDAATVRHLVSEALNVTNTVSGDAFISNLRVAYAQMVSATIGDLCIKASDGNYYLIDVNSNGTVTATQTTVTAQEIAQGHTNAGDVIVASDITAASLSTSDIFATYALVNKIDAARIDVDQLYARQAFIDRLNTTDIRSNSYIQMMVGEAQREASQWRVIVTSTDADCVLIGTGSTTLSAQVYYGAEDMTDSIPASLFSWSRSSGNATADATWNSQHSGMKSVTVTAGEASYNAVYNCNVDNGSIAAVLGTGKLGMMMLGIGA